MQSDHNAKRRARHAEIADAVNARRRERYAAQRENVLAAARADRVVCQLCGRGVRRLYLAKHQSRHNCIMYCMKHPNNMNM